jgi:hypothetical protein
MLVLYYGLTRVFLAVSRDGLLPPAFARLNPRTAHRDPGAGDSGRRVTPAATAPWRAQSLEAPETKMVRAAER